MKQPKLNKKDKQDIRIGFAIIKVFSKENMRDFPRAERILSTLIKTHPLNPKKKKK